jgi:lipopolysaccharide/colanic/teichoic acid biosynthesis glycosyltransferase
VRPGITGLAQASMRVRGDAGAAAAPTCDYARGAGVWRDLRILCLTLGRLTGKGSN